MLNNIRRVGLNILVRQKKLSLICTVILCLILHLYTRSPGAPKQPEPSKPIDIVKKRNDYINPIYRKFDGISSLPEGLEDRCSLYFKELSNMYPGTPGPDIIDLEFNLDYDFDKTIYREKSWLKVAKRKLKKSLRRQNKRYSGQNDGILRAQYQEEVSTLVEFESRVTQEFNHKRVFGKCYLNNEQQLNEKQESLCAEYQRKLYPWLTSEKYPRFENWRRERLPMGQVPIYDSAKIQPEDLEGGCLLSSWKKKSNGKGIVIPVFPTTIKDKQLTNLKNLIKVIRLSKNRLPIEILFMDGSLSESDKKALVKEARTEKGSLPESYDEYLQLVNDIHPFKSDKDYPKQELWFVDMSNMLNGFQHPLIPHTYHFHSPNFVLSLSTIFNSFEEFVVFGERAIPLIDDLAGNLLNNPNYQQKGQLFFKNPLRQRVQRRRLKPGFSEVNDLLKVHFMPSGFDQHYMSLKRRKSNSDSSLVFEEDLQDILDTNVMAINKMKHLSGLMLSCNLQLYKLLDARFNIVRGEVLGDFIWLGIEISGASRKVYFNRFFGSASGVLTPLENKPYDTVSSSNELCSSSWSQVSDVDEQTLLYVTSHQLENWLYVSAFKEDLGNKFTIKKKVHKEDYDKMVKQKAEKEEGVKQEENQQEVRLSPEEMVELEELAFERRYKKLHQNGQTGQNEVNEQGKSTEQKESDEQESINKQEKSESQENVNVDPGFGKRDVTSEEEPENKDNRLENELEEKQENKLEQNKLESNKLEENRLEENPETNPENQVNQLGNNVPEDPEANQNDLNLVGSNKQGFELPRLKLEDGATDGKDDTHFVVKPPPADDLVELDDLELAKNTVGKNPLYIMSTIRPPNVVNPVFDSNYREPKLGWLHQETFAGYVGHHYWCAYDIVGSPLSQNRGLVDNYGQTQQAKYRSVLDVWLK